MSNMKDPYQWILESYPETISKEQLCKICHISKRTALALLTYGIIPNQNSGKQTHKYSIKTTDVITFLKTCSATPNRFMIPSGWYSHSGKTIRPASNDSQSRLKIALTLQLQSYPDVLTPKQIQKITGFTLSSITEWCSSGRLYHYRIQGKNLIPKIAFVAFIVDGHFHHIKQTHKQKLFLIEKKFRIDNSYSYITPPNSHQED